MWRGGRSDFFSIIVWVNFVRWFWVLMWICMGIEAMVGLSGCICAVWRLWDLLLVFLKRGLLYLFHHGAAIRE